MSWITVDTKLGNHPKMAALPSDAARYGWVLTLLEAKEQRHPGTFASSNHFRLVMGRHGRFLPDYIKAGLLDKGDDDTIHVHDWKRHQWSIAKAKQRGQDEDIEGTFVGQKEDASRAVPVYVSNGSSEGVQGEPSELLAFIARCGAFMRPDSGFGVRLTQLVDRRGLDVVMAAAAQLATGPRLSDRQWVFGLERALEAIPEPDTVAVASKENSERIYSRMMQRRIEHYRATAMWPEDWGPMPRELQDTVA